MGNKQQLRRFSVIYFAKPVESCITTTVSNSYIANLKSAMSTVKYEILKCDSVDAMFRLTFT